MMQKIGILGSTGSIGTQALDIISDSEDYQVEYLSCLSNFDKLVEQCFKHHPAKVCIVDKNKEKLLINSLKDENIEVLSGFEGLWELSKEPVDLMLNSIVGSDGMKPSIIALENDIKLALANKESMVMAGWLIKEIQKNKKNSIIPVDSEHSAIFQCLKGEKLEDVKRIILTGSGGPFRQKNINEFGSITLNEALNHPNWEMGSKITIDSATMMNKGLEYIEAYWLFDLPCDKIDIVVHPQSIIHSMVEFIDGSIKAQMGEPDMKVPIQYAFTYPLRIKNSINKFDFMVNNNLTFEEPDLNKFPCIKLAKDALLSGGSHQVVLNVANDFLVGNFLNKRIHFTDIPKMIEDCISRHSPIESPTLDEIDSLSIWTKEYLNKEVLNA
tara:strand:- start:756 stop:1907 length:1152 start_codon:yes stop_codon:yes gene_type:complete